MNMRKKMLISEKTMVARPVAPIPIKPIKSSLFGLIHTNNFAIIDTDVL